MTRDASAGRLVSWARDARAVGIWREVAGAVSVAVWLKGPTIGELLYTDGVDRTYNDVDILISSAAAPTARRALTDLGYELTYGVEDALGARDVHASTWQRGRDGACVDLHTNLPGLMCSPARSWEVLSTQRRLARVAGQPVPALDAAATALLVAVHAASHGPSFPKPLEDLRRAVATWPDELWTEAADLAQRLDSTAVFASGLHLVPAGAALASRLGLANTVSPEQRLTWTDAPWGAHAIHGLAAANGLRERARLVARLAFPPPRSMRLGTPLARRGRRGLAVAYAVRPVRLAARAPAAFRAWRLAQSAD